MKSAIYKIGFLTFFLLFFSVFFFIYSLAENQSKSTYADVSIGSNFRIYSSNVTQTETFITKHPTNPDILFASANTFDLGTGFVSEGIYVSTNGGNSWNGSDTCNGSPIGLHGADPGIAIDKEGRFVLIRLGPSFLPGLYSHFSTDNGLTWSSQKTVVMNDQDRAGLASDGIPTSNFFGRSYAVWVRFAQPFPVFFSSTDDGGENWTSAAQVNNPIRRCQGGEAAIGPDGTIFLTWAGVIDTSPFTEDFVGVALSTDGGSNWNVTENAFDINGIKGILAEKANIRVNGLPRIDVDKSGGARNGWIYIVTNQKDLSPAGNDPDIILNRSTDGGQTWSAGIRVNQDALNNGKIQYFPAVHVDDAGGLNIIYYDDRNTNSDSTAVFLSRSLDGGDTWMEFEISDHRFKPVPIGGLGQGYQGDNIDLTSTNNRLWPVWMDNSTGIYQIWTVPIDISSTAIEDKEANRIPDEFRLHQNYPNPFNPNTSIKFRIPKSGFVSLAIYDITGKKIASLVNEHKLAGTHSVAWNAANHPSGVYFYTLLHAEFSATKRMLLIR
jgi:hypothetical protein